jgi:hypothetical protein
VRGVPADSRYHAVELTELDLRNTAPGDMLPRLSRNFHTIFGVNLATGERILTRIVVDRTPDAR